MRKCSKCGRPNVRNGQRYCAGCHAAYQRAWRKRYVTISREELAKRRGDAIILRFGDELYLIT